MADAEVEQTISSPEETPESCHDKSENANDIQTGCNNNADTTDVQATKRKDGSFPLGMTEDHSKALREISRRATRVSKRKRESRVNFATVPEVICEAYEKDMSKDGKIVEEANTAQEIIEEQKELMKYIEDNVIGNDTTFKGPFGKKRVIYCDYTASGRPVRFIEDYISQHVHPLYANTHTTTGVMARQTTQFREESRTIIKKSVNANDNDALIFCGSGTTAAVNKLVSALELTGEKTKNAVVLVGPYEHHSNILPWIESGAKVVRIKDNKNGNIDMEDLENKLKKYHKKARVFLGCFSAASNVTGIISDTLAVSGLLHSYGAFSFWDYATAGPYLNIDMNPPPDKDGRDCSKDAVYMSPHKFVGGVGTPGLLIAKKKVFTNEVPDTVGGGTVVYVTRDTHHYHKNIEEREEGGTPAIVESIRAGLTFKLKDSIGAELIEDREEELTKLAFKRWKQNKNIIFLGSTRTKRLPIFSFLISHAASGKMLHHDFVAVLLNDLYGIQARGGCACAGPYAQDLLGIDENLAQKFAHFLVDERENNQILKKKKKSTEKDCKTCEKSVEIMKPGFVRLNLPFFFCEEAINYILTAIERIANDGWTLLPQYQVEPFHAKWSYISVEDLSAQEETTNADSLLRATFKGGKFRAPPSPFMQREVSKKTYDEMLHDAEMVFQKAKDQRLFAVEALTDAVGAAVQNEQLIWFLRPHEAALFLRKNSRDAIDDDTVEPSKTKAASNAPFVPKRYTFRRSFRNSFRKITRSKKQAANYEKVKSGGEIDERKVNDRPDGSRFKKNRKHSKCLVM